jgi:YfiR/HmsC-like
MWAGHVVFAQSVEVPIDVQVPLFLKATTYDRTFPTKLQKNDVLQVGICYQPDLRTTVAEMEALKAAFETPMTGFKIRITLINFAEDEDIAAIKAWPTLSAIYITSMRGLDLKTLLEQAQRHQVLTVATDPAIVAKGTAIGFELVGGRPKFVINRKATIDEGCEFSSQLLKLARVL